jgi:thiamine biosynthesis lipoprotein
MALDSARRTDGLVNPTPTAPGSWRHVRVAGRLVFRYPGTKLDLNGVVEGLAVDAAAQELGGDGFVSAGGDLAVRGTAVVGLPGGRALTVRNGGLATSRARRRRLRDGEAEHYLIDPRTGRPSASPWREVTVAAGSCLEADVAAKAAFLLGEDGPDWLDERGLPGCFRAGGIEVGNKAWRRAVERAAAAA